MKLGINTQAFIDKIYTPNESTVPKDIIVVQWLIAAKFGYKVVIAEPNSIVFVFIDMQ
jgi:hypothetical protein